MASSPWRSTAVCGSANYWPCTGPAVDLDGEKVTVLHTLRAVQGGGFRLEPPKSERSRRSIDLPAAAVAALREQRERMRAEGHDVEAGTVFPTRTGNYISGSNLARQTWKPLLKRAGLPVRKFHTLRHTYA